MRVRSLLAPLGWAYGSVGRMRREAARRGWLGQTRLAGPVLSVGNLTVGGSGKTPVVALIASMLAEAGHPVAILSRGYRGGFRGPALIVSDGERLLADAREAGDEPVMLARETKGVVVAVGPRRDVVGLAVEERFGPCVHLLDDGFQHLRLARDLDIVCVTPADLVDRPLPAGLLREPASSARLADVVLAAGDEAARLWVRERLGHGRVFRMQRRFRGFVDRQGREQPPPLRPFGFCGIARPGRFFEDLAAQLPARCGTLAFRDHHRFSSDDLHRIVGRAADAGADALVTTAKDAVRLPDQDLPLPLVILRIGVTIEPAQPFRQLLLDAVARRGRGDVR